MALLISMSMLINIFKKLKLSNVYFCEFTRLNPAVTLCNYLYNI
jgi:hypothetical protein